MRIVPLVAALALVTFAVPAASAGHTYASCVGIWDPVPPPGWEAFCAQLDWLSHNPVMPLVECLVAPLEIYVVGVKYELAEALACI